MRQLIYAGAPKGWASLHVRRRRGVALLIIILINKTQMELVWRYEIKNENKKK